MSAVLQLAGSQVSNVVEVAAAAYTTSGNSGVLGGYAPASTLIIQQSVTVITGTLPTLDMVVEDTLDGINWRSLGTTFAQVLTVTGTVYQVVTVPFTDRIRVRWTLGGTLPSYTMSVQVFAKGILGSSR